MCRYGRVMCGPLASSVGVVTFVLSLAAGATTIPYGTWWLVWALLTFVGAPLIAVAAVRRGRGWLGFVPFLASIVTAVVIVGVAASCHSFGLYAPRGCSPTQAFVTGTVALGVALGIDVWIAVHLSRVPHTHRPMTDRHAYCRTCNQWLTTVEDHNISHHIDWHYQPDDTAPP